MSSIKMANGALVAYYELEYFFDRQNMSTCMKKIRLQVFFLITMRDFFSVALKESSLTRDAH